MSYLKVEGLSFKYHKSKDMVVNNFFINMNKGEILALVGDSGSGKSTVLRLLTGLETPLSGRITLDGDIMFCKKTNIQPEHRNIGMIFQDYALFPHLTVLKNVQFAVNQGCKKEKCERAISFLKLVRMEEHGDKYPHQCSGGQQQRIAIARAMAANPKLLLLDEPFSNLDSKLRNTVREEVKEIIKAAGISAILVTHDNEDVRACADRAVQM